MAKYLTDRQDRKLAQTIRKVDSLTRNGGGGGLAVGPQWGTPGTDFTIEIVPRTTIPAATRTIQAGMDEFLPGEGTAWLLKRNRSTGVLEQRIDELTGNPIWKPIFNLDEVHEYLPNIPESSDIKLSDGSAFTMSDGTPITLSGAAAISADDVIGPETAVLLAVVTREGRLELPARDQGQAVVQPRMEKATALTQFKPDMAGSVIRWVSVETGTVQDGSSNTIKLEGTSSSIPSAEYSSNDFLNGWMVRIVSGPDDPTGRTPIGQTRWILDWDGTTKVATIASWYATELATGLIGAYPWLVPPDGDRYEYELFEPEVVRAYWAHAENHREIFKGEELWIQKSVRGYYEIVQASDNSLIKANVTEPGGIADGQTGEITFSTDGVVGVGFWEYATSGKHLAFGASIAVAFNYATPLGDADEFRTHQIWVVDCRDLASTAP